MEGRGLEKGDKSVKFNYTKTVKEKHKILSITNLNSYEKLGIQS